MKIEKKDFNLLVKKLVICTFGIFLLGISGAINIKAALGADPITVFYEGLSKFVHLNLGMTINILNSILTLIIFFVDRKYLHLGTLVYVLTLGSFVNFGVWAYEALCIPDIFWVRLAVSLFGCFIAFVGLGMYISVDTGIDPWSAISVIINKKSGKSFRLVRTAQDATTLILGVLMGGKFGIITVFCVLAGGVIIQKSIEIVDKLLANMLESKCEK